MKLERGNEISLSIEVLMGSCRVLSNFMTNLCPARAQLFIKVFSLCREQRAEFSASFTNCGTWKALRTQSEVLMHRGG